LSVKTRIVSAIIGLLLFGCVLIFRNRMPIILDICISIINFMAVWEILDSTKLVKNRKLTAICSAFAIILPFVNSGFLPVNKELFNVVFGVVVLVSALAMYKTLKISELACAFAFTWFVSYAFSSLLMIIRMADGQGLFYFILAFSFAWSCDGGAYFCGILFGKRKLAPVISPKKTVEGAVGGIVCSVIMTFIMCIGYNFLNSGVYSANILLLVLITPFFAVAGILGDLLASFIKRSCNIKDYGNIIPGHGGILDRFDSIMLIAPLMYVALNLITFVNPV
ncbi:MAG: CDP-archaeol synthase, partial [Oscillospiraceae bacterium]